MLKKCSPKSFLTAALLALVILCLAGCGGSSESSKPQPGPYRYYSPTTQRPRRDVAQTTPKPGPKPQAKAHPKAEPYPPSEPDYDPDNLAHRKLSSTHNLSALAPETPFSQAIDVLRNSTTPPLNIVVLWSDLELNTHIDRTTPIGMNAVDGISVRTNLELLLWSVSSGKAELAYTIWDGVIVIATRDSLPTKMTTRVYDITDLTARPADYYLTTSAQQGP